MVDDPPDSSPTETKSEPGSDRPERADEPRPKRVDSIISELVRKAIERGLEKAVEAPENLKELVSGLRVPKEVASYILGQVDETKTGLLRVVAKETREFLEHANLAKELQKLLTLVQFEINTTVRFRPSDPPHTPDEEPAPRMPKPEVSTQIHVGRDKPGKS